MLNTKQAIFNKVVKHLLTQNKKAQDAFNRCRYRTPDGLTCAVGCLIKNNAYMSTIEFLKATHPNVEACLVKSGVGITEGKRFLLQSLQYVHDEEVVDNWPFALLQVAEHYELKVPKILKDRLGIFYLKNQ